MFVFLLGLTAVLKLINNSSSKNKENHNREGARFENTVRVLIGIDVLFDDFTSSFAP